ncbi:MBL fold metallo-hydrolase [Sphaerisporangium fuscum]|uniref:MBL fold metallo-hydrolase n=1 Tax=Sphaerisporangium fuscum TaxID=2835868 RepID=UPI003556A040
MDLVILTKSGHACVRLEKNGRSLVIDPGRLTPEPDVLTGAEAVLVTHEHFDHLDADRLFTFASRHSGGPHQEHRKEITMDAIRVRSGGTGSSSPIPPDRRHALRSRPGEVDMRAVMADCRTYRGHYCPICVHEEGPCRTTAPSARCLARGTSSSAGRTAGCTPRS